MHILLHKLFDHKEPKYFHHDLIMDAGGQKLAKSKKHTSLRELKSKGQTSEQIREKLGFT
jgi:glutamyl-Q tRNA(Asp) synthetase